VNGSGCVCLHVSPHPDDESLGAPGTLLLLIDAGWSVINLACSLGRPDQAGRRLGELTVACERLGFELVLPEGAPAQLDGEKYERGVRAAVTHLLRDRRVDLVVAPNPHDGHPAHEAVGRAVVAAVGEAADPPRLWMWRLWGDAALPTLLVPLDASLLARAGRGLAAHRGELARADYVTVLEARAEVAAVLDAERAFGFGSAPRLGRFCEALTEVLTDRRPGLMAAAPRRLDPTDPLEPAVLSGVDLAPLWSSPSSTSRVLAQTRPAPPPAPRQDDRLLSGEGAPGGAYDVASRDGGLIA